MPTLLTALLLLIEATPALGPFIASGNFAYDLDGVADFRAGTWGKAASQSSTLTFKPPPGYRVRILRISGDLVAWPKLPPGALPHSGYAGVLIGAQTTAQQGSVRGDWMADNTCLYVQAGLSNDPIRAAFDRALTGCLLEADNKLVFPAASWLNTTGVPIHLETTFTIQYQWEK